MDATIIEPQHPRMLPALTDLNRAFWTGGATGRLLIGRCGACGRWVHPPVASCPGCAGAIVAEPVSGRGTVFTWTLNMQQFHPDIPPPNLIAIVELAEQSDLRIPTNLVGCDADRVRCGLPVRVLFEHHGEIYYPVFEPDGA